MKGGGGPALCWGWGEVVNPVPPCSSFLSLCPLSFHIGLLSLPPHLLGSHKSGDSHPVSLFLFLPCVPLQPISSTLSSCWRIQELKMATQIFPQWYHNGPLERDSLLQLLGHERWTAQQLAPEAPLQMQGPPPSQLYTLPSFFSHNPGRGGSRLGLSIFQETMGLI